MGVGADRLLDAEKIIMPYEGDRVARALIRIATQSARDAATTFSMPIKELGERDQGKLTSIIQEYFNSAEGTAVVQRLFEDVALVVLERLVGHADQGIEVDGVRITLGAIDVTSSPREIGVGGVHDSIVGMLGDRS